MTRSFYDLFGVRQDASLDEIRAAYGRAVAHVLRRREATLAQGGDASALNLGRAQMDEAWEVLSDGARRRRYDAMLAVANDGVAGADVDDLWSRVAGAMIPPGVAAAARIVDAVTTLSLSPLPELPRPSAIAAAETTYDDEVATAISSPRPAPARSSTNGFGAPRVVARPAAPEAEVVPLRAEASPPLRMVRTRDVPAEVVEFSPGPPTTPLGSVVQPSEQGEVDALVDRLGYSGALLRALRERQGLALQQLSESTRISGRYLEAIEREDFAALPPGQAFVRGYVREMARILGLDVERAVAGYMRRFSHDA